MKYPIFWGKKIKAVTIGENRRVIIAQYNNEEL